MGAYQLAQINIARAVAPMDSIEMEGFVNRLDEINLLADNFEGFVWRLQESDGNSTNIQAYDDPRIIINMSVWTTLESLKKYVYKSVHVELIRDRDAWFSKISSAHMALWWVPVGHVPTVKEGKERLETLDKQGPSIDAFTFAKPFHLS